MVGYLEAEEYRFYRLYSIDLDGARQCAQMLRRYSEKDVRYSIIRDVIVTYARPFSKNRGRFLKSHRLSDAIVPPEFAALHTELIGLRDQAFAHTDHDFRNPQLLRWPKIGSADSYIMGFTNPPWESLDARTDQIEALVTAVERAVNEWVSRFEREKLDDLRGS